MDEFDTVQPEAAPEFQVSEAKEVSRSWFYGPDGQAEIFDSDDAPSGWKDHPSKVKGGKARDEAAPAKFDMDAFDHGEDDLMSSPAASEALAEAAKPAPKAKKPRAPRQKAVKRGAGK